MPKNLLIVESPAKAKTINKYLGKDFHVLASYGHVRDLVPKEGAVDPDAGFAMRYEVIDKNEKHVDAIARPPRAPTRSSSRPTRIAKARRSAGTSRRS
jgi:DNA topoisomerase-1